MTARHYKVVRNGRSKLDVAGCSPAPAPHTRGKYDLLHQPECYSAIKMPFPLQFSSHGGANTSPSDDASLNFLVLGDWGGQETHPYTTPAEVELAGVMGKKASEIGSRFTLALGDNFYSEGVKDVNDKRFQQTFEVRLCCSKAFVLVGAVLPHDS